MSRTLHVTETCSAHTGKKKDPAKSGTLHMTRIVLLLTQKVKLIIVIKLHTILRPQKSHG